MHHSEMHISEHTCPRLKTNMSETQGKHVRDSGQKCPRIRTSLSTTQDKHVQDSGQTCPRLMSETQDKLQDSGQTHLTHIQHGRHTCWSTHVRAHMLEHTCRSTHVGAHMSEHICPGLREHMSETQSKHVRDARRCVLLSQHVRHLSARNTHTAPCLAHLGAY